MKPASPTTPASAGPAGLRSARPALVALCAALAAAILWWRPAPPPATPQARAALETLEDVLRSKDDNDPRLDRSFDGLSDEAKTLLRDAYGRLPRERRAERGTIVYVLGRNLVSPRDWEFLASVIAEPPCLSLADCDRRAPLAAGDEITLAYPALVALRQARRVLEGSRDGPQALEALRVLRAGFHSPVPAVVRTASRLSR
ncbi:MAG: hypothetical protein HY553_03380 [Elusimicrobia bacterium]|nr:hypothetical protein [Elusimicrobiota bacterium]